MARASSKRPFATRHNGLGALPRSYRFSLAPLVPIHHDPAKSHTQEPYSFLVLYMLLAAALTELFFFFFWFRVARRRLCASQLINIASVRVCIESQEDERSERKRKRICCRRRLGIFLLSRGQEIAVGRHCLAAWNALKNIRTWFTNDFI